MFRRISTIEFRYPDKKNTQCIGVLCCLEGGNLWFEGPARSTGKEKVKNAKTDGTQHFNPFDFVTVASRTALKWKANVGQHLSVQWHVPQHTRYRRLILLGQMFSTSRGFVVQRVFVVGSKERYLSPKHKELFWLGWPKRLDSAFVQKTTLQSWHPITPRKSVQSGLVTSAAYHFELLLPASCRVADCVFRDGYQMWYWLGWWKIRVSKTPTKSVDFCFKSRSRYKLICFDRTIDTLAQKEATFYVPNSF